jgi:uncharacterized protein
MKIAVFANTPAQIHFYKNIIRELKEHGHEVRVLARDYGETLDVAESMGHDFYIYSKSPLSKIGKVIIMPFEIGNAYKILRRFKPDIITGFGIYDAFTSALLRTKCIVFEDSEPELTNLPYSIPYRACLPFVDAIITPCSFSLNIGKKQMRVNGFKELAYLHPNYYRPDESIKELLRLKGDEEYVLLRFNAFDAVHDLGIRGFSMTNKVRLVSELEKYAKVFISSEAGVPDEIKDRVMKIPKNRIHDAIYYAKILVTDTQTMTTEAAILGTPAIRCNQFVGPNDMGIFVDLEKKYGLIFNYSEPDKSINKAVELIQKHNLKQEWTERRDKLLKDNIDITTFMVWFIENYPDSHEIHERESKVSGQIQ